MAVGALHHPEAERAILAATMIDPEFAEQFSRELRASDFASAAHQCVFRALCRVQAAGRKVDIRTLQADLAERGELERVGGLSYLAELDADLPALDRVGAYVEIVRAASVRRGLVDSCETAAARAKSGTPSGEIIGELSTALRSLEETATAETLSPIGDTFGQIVHRLEHPSLSGLVGVSTGYAELDAMTLGWVGGQMIVLAARPGVGKTSLACSFARAAADKGTPVAFYSLEMAKEELTARFVSSETGIAFWRIRNGHLSEQDRREVRAALADLADAPLFLNDSSSLSPGRLSAMLRKAKREHGIGLAVIDYLGLMASDEGSRAENQNLKLAEITRSVKVLAKDLDLPIIALHQLSRAPEKRTDPRPVLSDLRDSGAVEQDADLVLFIYREQSKAPDAPAADAELILAKHRNGATGTIRVRQALESFRFESLSPGGLHRVA